MVKKQKKDKSLILEFFGDCPFMRVIDALLDSRYPGTTPTQIAKISGLQKKVVQKTLRKMEWLGWIKEIKDRKIKYIKLNERNEVVRAIEHIEVKLIENAMKRRGFKW